MKVWEFIQQKKSSGNRLMLLYVLESKGSSPGRQGFKMAVASDGDFIGTIGGGIMEHKFVELAKDKLTLPLQEPVVVKQIHDKSAAQHQSGMICSGEQTIFIYEITGTDLLVVKQLLHTLKHNQQGTLLLSKNGLEFSTTLSTENFIFAFSETETSFLYKEKIGFKNHLVIIGGGHCSLALSQLMSTMDFYITIYEERESLNTFVENQFAHQKISVYSYAALAELLKDGSDVYVVIMTFGYRSDDMALRALMDKSFRYMGLLGSKNKIKKLFETYNAENINPAILQKIHAPIGLHIKSETTYEIAVSIAAEIILIKNSR